MSSSAEAEPSRVPERKVAEVRDISPCAFHNEIVPGARPVVLRGLIDGWPAVRAGRASGQALADYVSSFDRGHPVGALMGPSRIRGRFTYNDDLQSFNFKRQSITVSRLLRYVMAAENAPDPLAYAMQSVPIPLALSGLEKENCLDLVDPNVMPRAWIGNRVVVSAHQDLAENLACVVAGRRVFTLFPPHQVRNLYIGPFDITPAGTPISLVDFDDPDLSRFPRFADALEWAEVAELGPGDAIYIPYKWWHHVRSIDAVNMLVNYWWPDARQGRAPMEAMRHAAAVIGRLPEAHRDAWRASFEHYVFRLGGDPGEHLPMGLQDVAQRLVSDGQGSSAR